MSTTAAIVAKLIANVNKISAVKTAAMSASLLIGIIPTGYLNITR